jgi:hypothetical protein
MRRLYKVQSATWTVAVDYEKTLDTDIRAGHGRLETYKMQNLKPSLRNEIPIFYGYAD